MAYFSPLDYFQDSLTTWPRCWSTGPSFQPTVSISRSWTNWWLQQLRAITQVRFRLHDFNYFVLPSYQSSDSNPIFWCSFDFDLLSTVYNLQTLLVNEVFNLCLSCLCPRTGTRDLVAKSPDNPNCWLPIWLSLNESNSKELCYLRVWVFFSMSVPLWVERMKLNQQLKFLS